MTENSNSGFETMSKEKKRKQLSVSKNILEIYNVLLFNVSNGEVRLQEIIVES